MPYSPSTGWLEEQSRDFLQGPFVFAEVTRDHRPPPGERGNFSAT
jgi:hypothetical protein